MGVDHHRYYKHTKFHQYPRGDPKFLVDLTWNDPYAIAPMDKQPTILYWCGQMHTPLPYEFYSREFFHDCLLAGGSWMESPNLSHLRIKGLVFY